MHSEDAHDFLNDIKDYCVTYVKKQFRITCWIMCISTRHDTIKHAKSLMNNKNGLNFINDIINSNMVQI